MVKSQKINSMYVQIFTSNEKLLVSSFLCTEGGCKWALKPDKMDASTCTYQMERGLDDEKNYYSFAILTDVIYYGGVCR